MFTGIITETGVITDRTKSTLSVRVSRNLIGKLTRGASVALNGACLTVVGKHTNIFSAEIMGETASRTTLGTLKSGASVNLELPATPGTFLSGHIVQGHVDGIGRVKKITRKGGSVLLRVSIPKQLSKYVVEKGSIAINGISLTVIAITNSICTVGIIPHTWETTNLHALRRGDSVNVEVDVLAKYVEKLKAKSKKPK